MKKEAQVSIEIMIMLVMLLFVLTLIITVNDVIMTNVEGNFNSRKANLLLDTISQTGNFVYQQGSGALYKVFVAVPSGVEEISMSGRVINLTLNTSGDAYKLYRKTNFNMTGSVPIEPGNYWLLFNSTEDMVEITWLNTT